MPAASPSSSTSRSPFAGGEQLAVGSEAGEQLAVGSEAGERLAVGCEPLAALPFLHSCCIPLRGSNFLSHRGA